MASRHPVFILSATLLLAAAFALSACAQGALQASQTPAASQPAPQSTLEAKPAPAADAAPQAEPEPAQPVTQERASATCWMTYESRRGLSLDARMKLVDKCIDARMKAGR